MKELEMILAAVAQLGEAGKEAFIWWLFFDKGLTFIGWITTVLIASFVVKRIVQGMSLGPSLRDAMGVGSPGPVSESEARQMFKWIAERTDRPAK